MRSARVVTVKVFSAPERRGHAPIHDRVRDEDVRSERVLRDQVHVLWRQDDAATERGLHVQTDSERLQWVAVLRLLSAFARAVHRGEANGRNSCA